MDLTTNRDHIGSGAGHGTAPEFKRNTKEDAQGVAVRSSWEMTSLGGVRMGMKPDGCTLNV